MSLNNRPENVHDERMKIIMNVKRLQTLQQITDFLHGSCAFEPAPATQTERYQWIDMTLQHFRYASRTKAEKGLLIAYLCRISGYSRQQMTRLIQRYRDRGKLLWDVSPTKGFVSHYTTEDIRLLAEIDTLHDTLSGPAAKKLCERAWLRFDDQRFERLAGISVAHLYNLRKRTEYRKVRVTYEKTRPTKNMIGVRRKPKPQGRPGFIRIDTVHQGDQDGKKGLYHINAVDEVTQFEVVFTVERISEQFMIPALAALLETFPFQILGFHADNGSEYINRQVAELLEKLRIELTKSRSRHCNDNALAESKNAAVVRKILGYCHIPQKFAPQVNRFNQEHLVPYVNYHRPCFFPEIITDAKGRKKKRYRYEHMTTPYEKLKSLPNAKQFLKPGLSFQSLDDIAYAISDNEAANRLQEARHQLFESIDERLLAS
jgi:transposase InsO family protein